MSTRTTKLAAGVIATAVVGLSFATAEAVIVTVGGTEIVFDSNGFESDTAGSNPASANANGTYQLNNTNGVTVTNGTYTGTEANGATGASEGSNYLVVDRSVSGGTANSWIVMEFTRDIDPDTESFTIEFAQWGTTIGSSGEWTGFSVGDATADGTSSGTANVLTSWGYHATLGDLVSFTNSGSTPVDQSFDSAWNVGEWNNIVYSWDANTQTATLSVNGNDITLINQLDDPTVVNQFHIRANSSTSEVYIDAIPEPGSLGLLTIGAAMMFVRKRRGSRKAS